MTAISDTDEHEQNPTGTATMQGDPGGQMRPRGGDLVTMGHGSNTDKSCKGIVRGLRRTFSLAFAVIALALGTVVPATASAEPMTVGQVAPMNPWPICQTSTGNPVELLVSSTEGGNAFAAPIAGTITSWSTTASYAPGQQVGMKIYKPVPGTEEKHAEYTLPPGVVEYYTVVAHDGPHILKPGALNTFGTDIPVKAGDIVGYYSANGSKTTPNACFYDNLVATDYMALNETSTSDGSSVYLPTLVWGARANVSAILQPPPTVASVSPASGPVSGGTSVSITGTDLENATAVSFGGAPAAEFRVVSEREVVATTPAGIGPVAVTATVATVAGAATGGSFTYEGPKGASPGPNSGRGEAPGSCVVPKLRGKKLRIARRELRRSHCRLGQVKGNHQRKIAIIERQHPADGKVRARGAMVNVVLGRRRR